VNGLPLLAFKITVYGKEVIKEIDGINRKSANSVTVDFDLGKVAGKQKSRYVWVKGQTGIMIPGRWEEVDKENGPGANSVLNVDRDTARKVFEESHGHLDLSRP
jgi:hypothetical protein